MGDNGTNNKKWLKITSIVLNIALLIGIIFSGAILYFRLPASDYYSASEKAFEIPEIDEGYIPQGIHYDDDSQTFILSGYNSNKKASPIYLLDKKGELLKKVTFLDDDGDDYCGHGGGIAVYGDYIYLAGGEECAIFVYSFEELLNANDDDKLARLGTISLMASEDDYLGIAFVTVVGDRLITGEFYREESYPTLDSHKITTKAGDYNQALAIEYKLDDAFEFAVNPEPIKAYSLPDQVQGLTIYNNKIYLSTSWGLSFSHIYEYNESAVERQDEDITVLGKTLPLYALDKSSLTSDYLIAPMSEEIVFVDGYLYVSSESASDKYIFGKFTGGKWFYKTNLEEMEKFKVEDSFAEQIQEN